MAEEQAQTLRDLIDVATKRHHARGSTDLERAARQSGFKINRTTINLIRGGTYNSRPGRPVLEAIAWLAGVTLDTVYMAAEVPVPGPPFAKELPGEIDQLTREERDVILHLVRVFLNRHRKGELT